MKTISREDLKGKIERGDDFVLLEVLSEQSYGRGHLPGAIRFPDMDTDPRPPARQNHRGGRLLLELQLTLLDAGRP